MARASYNSLRLRDLTVEDLEKDDRYLLRLYVALRRILLHTLTPVWPFHLLEDIFSVPIEEIIRYSPDLWHLRSRVHYGEPQALPDDDVPGSAFIYDMVHSIRGQESEIISSLYPSLDAKIDFNQKLAYRNQGEASLERSLVRDRFDLDVTHPMILGEAWTLSELDGYIQWMSFRHDWGRYPSAQVIDLILRHSAFGSIPSAVIEELSEVEMATEMEG